MRTTIDNLFAIPAVLLVCGGLAADTFAQYDVRFAVESGGLDTGTCPVTAPCTITRALSQATDSGDTVAVRIRRAGDKGVLGNVTFLNRLVYLAVYNEERNTSYPYFLAGDLDLRGTVDLDAGSAASVGYANPTGKLIISGSRVNVIGGGISGTGSFSAWATSNTFRGNVVFSGTTTLTHSGTNPACVVFQHLQVASTGRLTVEGSCSNSVPAISQTATGGGNAMGVTVWNILDVAGQLELMDGLNLNLIAPRPTTKADSAFSAPHKLPGGNISGSVSGTGTFYLAVEPDQVATTDSIFYGGTSEDDGDTARVFVATYTGWPNATHYGLDAEKSKIKRLGSDRIVIKNLLGDKFVIAGSGNIYMDLMKTTQAGASISPSFGTGAMSENSAGVLVVKSSTVRGHFLNTGRAQTEFTGRARIDRDVIVESFTASNNIDTRGGIGAAKASAAAAGNPVRECYGAAGQRAVDYMIRAGGAWPDMLGTSRGLTTGVYFKGLQTTIGGALEVKNGFKTLDGCYGGAYIMQPTHVTYDVLGLDVGPDDHAHFMIEGSLTLEGDFDLEGATNVVTRRRPSKPARTTGRTEGNICTNAKPKATGTHIIFTGSQTLQRLALPDDLDLSGIGLRVDKSTSQEVEITGGIVTTQSVDMQGGFLTTNGMLDIKGGNLLISQDQGATGDILRGTGRKAYRISKDKNDQDVVHVPDIITYTGSLASMDTGDELYDGISVNAVELYLDKVDTKLTLLSSITVRSALSLTRGTLDLPSGTTLNSPATLTVGHAYVNENGGKWTSAQSGTITFVGEQSRTTDNIVPAYATLEAAMASTAKLARVVVEGCAGSKKLPITLSLQKGYTLFGSGLDIRRSNVVDLAGNDAVAKKTIVVGAEAWLCNSRAGAMARCSGTTPAYDDGLGALTGALEALHYDGSADHRMAFDQARATFAASSAGAAKSSGMHGNVYAVGTVLLDLASSKERLKWTMPSFVVERASILNVTGRGVKSTTHPPVPPNNADEVTFESLTLKPGGGKTKAAGGQFNGIYGFDRYVINGNLSIDSLSAVALSPRAAGNHPQVMLMIGGDLTVGPAASLNVDKNYLGVTGNYTQGTAAGNASTVYIGGGAHHQMGSFYVGADTTAKAPSNFYFLRATTTGGDHGTTCNGASTQAGGYTVSSGLVAYSNYTFMGSGDAYDAADLPENQLGLRGTVTFAGADSSLVTTGGNARSNFCDVLIASGQAGNTGQISLGSDVTQHSFGRLTLKRGVVGTEAADHKWTLYNDAIEDSLVGRISISEDDPGVVKLGSRDAYFSGTVSRTVSKGNQGGGLISGGYLFPVGSAGQNGLSSYRPLIMQFPADLGRTGTAAVSYVRGMTADSLDWPDENLVVDGMDGGTLLLDNIADMFWKVELDAVPPHDPNIRLVPDGLPNIFNIKGLRIVQWDCDGSNPRLAGVYDVDDDGTDDNSLALNDFLNGVPNLTQEGVDVGTCAMFGVASNMLENPISADPITSGTARVQFIHNVVDASVDVYIDNNRVVDNFVFQSARAFGVVAAGMHTLDIVPATDADNSQPLVSLPIHFRPNKNYHVIAHGNAATGVVSIVTREDVRTASSVDNTVDFYLVHGASALGMVDIRIIDPIDNTRVIDLLANNLSFDDVGPYTSLDPGGYNLEMTTANNDTRIDVFRMEIRQYADLAFVLNLSGPGTSSGDGVTMMGVAEDGEPFFPQVITAAAKEELPTEFALLGNYPNPFNPSTRIEFDLPESAQVSITVFDVLGRNVMRLPAKEMQAGARRSIELNAASLASGSYFYRVVASGAAGLHVETGRMVLVK